DLFASDNIGGYRGGSEILRYTPAGIKSTFASNLHQPRGLAFDSAGNLFVATNTPDDSDIIHGTIFKITPDGLMSTFASGFLNYFLAGLVIDSGGNVFVVGGGPDFYLSPSTIYKVTPGGIVSAFGFFPGQPSGLVFDSTGNLFAAAIA